MRLITGVFTWELTSEELVILCLALRDYAYTKQALEPHNSAKADALLNTINRVLHPQ